MARGWESKSAEEQADEQQELREEAAKGISRQKLSAEGAARMRARQLLELKRERILSERTSHPVRRAALQTALKEVEAELKQLD